MGFSLAPTALAQGYRLNAHETVGSTNALALERARAGDAGRLWIVSKHQQTGRGRRGRAWATQPGNLAATLLLTDPGGIGTAATLGFVAGLALADAMRAVAANASAMRRQCFSLKWPNDVLAGNAKLAGIGLESTMTREGRLAVAIGIGVNVASHPDDLPYPAVSLKSLGIDCDAETLFLALSDAWVEKAMLWNGGQGLVAIRGQWLERAAGIGSRVSVLLDGRQVRGTFETIDETCRLIVRREDGTVSTITAGDVYFGAAASH